MSILYPFLLVLFIAASLNTDGFTRWQCGSSWTAYQPLFMCFSDGQCREIMGSKAKNGN